jgi:prepilin-type N-terminal cleavage/methylation domain-containing protein
MKCIPVHARCLSAGRRAFTLIELLVIIAIVSLLAALLMPVLGQAKRHARNILCISQLRQLGIAVRLYAEDNNASLPIAQPIPTMPVNPNAHWPRICDLLGPYLGNAAGATNSALVLKCPADNQGFFETEGSSYWWNARCNGQRIDMLLRPSGFGIIVGTNGVPHHLSATDFALVPMLIDFDDFHPRPPKTGRNAVYGDGHADKFAVPLPTLE